MAPTMAMWEHPSESAASVSASLHRTASRGVAGEAPRKRRSARIAAIRTRARLAGSSRPEPQARAGALHARAHAAPPPPPPQPGSSQRVQEDPERQRQRERLSPAPADTAAAAEAETAESVRARNASLAHVMWRTLVLMHSNRLLALQVEALKRETSAFICSVLSNPENRRLLPTPPPQQQQQQQPASS